MAAKAIGRAGGGCEGGGEPSCVMDRDEARVLELDAGVALMTRRGSTGGVVGRAW